MNPKEVYESCREAREEVAHFMRRLYEQGLTTCSGGNLSARIGTGHVIITPSALDKGRITGDQIGLLSLEGENLTPHLAVSMEARMHLRVYEARPEVRAIVHAHPVTATSFAAMTVDINTKLTAEAYAVLGVPVKAPYALMGTEGLAERTAEAVKGADVVILENHGILTVGSTLLAAFDRLEVLESAAKMTLFTSLMRGVSPLSADRVAELDSWKAARK